ncbi:helix-turn-helix transcriptional regulator [Myxococcota bacterium]
MGRATLGRPSGNFTQHRRLDLLREVLAKHQRGISLYDLANALNVTVRTMRRYLRELRRDCELETVPTRGGGPLLWRVRLGEAPRKVELRRTQAYALIAARRVFEPLRGSALFEEIDIAVDRLVSFARKPGRGPNAGLADARLEERFLYLPIAPKDYTTKSEELDDLFQAVADLRPLSCSYQSARKTAETRVTIHPYALVLHRGSIYCVGHHLGHGEVRTFLLDRMRDTECSATERFALPSDFSLNEYFQGAFGIWCSAERHRVVIEFDALAAPSVRMCRVHQTQKLAGIAGGGVRLSMVVGDLTQLVSWVLEWGPRARVLEPPELVERVKSELEAMLLHYTSQPKENPRPSRG